MSPIVGIDFGTTNSLVACVIDGQPKVLKSHEFEHLMPSVVCKYDGKLYVGRDAKDNIAAFVYGEGISEIKRKIGTGKAIYFDGENRQPYEISAIILKKIKTNVTLFFEREVNEAVITVPAGFSEKQRQEIILAGETAGFKVRKIINEPTAALLAYAYQNNIVGKKVICYDFGGGTFDVSIGRLEKNLSEKDIEIIASDGDRKLGGEDIDQSLAELIEKDIFAKTKKGLSLFGKRQLLLAAEKAKEELSFKTVASINFIDLELEGGAKTGYYRAVKRQELEALAKKYIQHTVDIVKRMLEEKELQPSDIDSVLLVGGSSRIPMIREKLKSQLNLKAGYGGMIPEECVALGASIEAANISGTLTRGTRTKIKQDVCPFMIGLKVIDKGDRDVFDPIIKKNHPYGQEYSKEYNTVADNQYSMYLEIYQGNSLRASQNVKITEMEISDIPESPAGMQKVKITFRYDQDGMLHIKAKILSRGKTFEYSYKYGYSVKTKDLDKKKLNDLFIPENKVQDAVTLIKAVQKHGDEKDAAKIREAVKYEDEGQLDSVMKSFLD